MKWCSKTGIVNLFSSPSCVSPWQEPGFSYEIHAKASKNGKLQINHKCTDKPLVLLETACYVVNYLCENQRVAGSLLFIQISCKFLNVPNVCHVEQCRDGYIHYKSRHKLFVVGKSFVLGKQTWEIFVYVTLASQLLTASDSRPC